MVLMIFFLNVGFMLNTENEIEKVCKYYSKFDL